MSDTIVDAPSRLRARLAQVTGIFEATSRFGREVRLAWRAGTQEIAHLHSAEIVDIRLPAILQRQWRGDHRLIPRPRRSDWIECQVRSDDDVEFAAMLVELAAQSSAQSTTRSRR
ncbi:MAG TPA: luciferase family protein [Casimicrobiaceae bacterium]|jgi:hypothetical protein